MRRDHPYVGKRVVDLAGKPFTAWKFRTMTHGDNPVFPDATRITAVGALLRRFSLDELPQLINVAAGEMSIVGPRPTLAYQVARCDDHQRRRIAVRPGLTGLAKAAPAANRSPWCIPRHRSDRIRTWGRAWSCSSAR